MCEAIANSRDFVNPQQTLILVGLKNALKLTEQLIISVPEGKIRDYIDGSFRKDTPEEYVRQNIEKRLVVIGNYNYTNFRK